MIAPLASAHTELETSGTCLRPTLMRTPQKMLPRDTWATDSSISIDRYVDCDADKDNRCSDLTDEK